MLNVSHGSEADFGFSAESRRSTRRQPFSVAAPFRRSAGLGVPTHRGSFREQRLGIHLRPARPEAAERLDLSVQGDLTHNARWLEASHRTAPLRGEGALK